MQAMMREVKTTKIDDKISTRLTKVRHTPPQRPPRTISQISLPPLNKQQEGTKKSMAQVLKIALHQPMNVRQTQPPATLKGIKG
jgi:hypothetical protein